ncbi:serine hydrolase family protein [Hoyosella sp. G463]|uniref:Serine hydrolase family protein n=1 Tax=Lolliginicoccus lacisalsi TaxID=2742202 RepID=A0A927JC03_9ACTN|nr:serine hydrolase family protein [Lolliginicoccus lacisalsi]
MQRGGTVRAIIVHGYSAHTGKHWFPWLDDELANRGHEVHRVVLPSPDEPDSGAWEAELARAIGPVDDETVLIGHSLGCLSLLRHLDALGGGWRLGGLVLVAGFLGTLPGLPELDACIGQGQGQGQGLDATALGARVRHAAVIHSDDDEIVPPELSAQLAEALGARDITVPGGGHFLEDELPEALAEVLAAAAQEAQ